MIYYWRGSLHVIAAILTDLVLKMKQPLFSNFGCSIHEQQSSECNGLEGSVLL